MAGEIARALITALLFVAISGGFAFPRVLRQSVLEANQNPPDVIEYDYDQSSPEPDGTTPSVFLELSTATALPEEVKEDLNKLAVIVEKEERERGHHMTRSELQEVEKQLEEVPWYKRLGNWIHKAYHSTKNAIKNVFSGDNARRDQRGFHAYFIE